MHQLTHPDHRQHRRVFENADQIVPHSCQCRGQRLWYDDAPIGLGCRKVDRLGGFPLALGHAFDPAAVDLGQIGGIVHSDCNQPGRPGRQAQTELRTDIVDKEYLQQQRGRTNEFDQFTGHHR